MTKGLYFYYGWSNKICDYKFGILIKKEFIIYPQILSTMFDCGVPLERAEKRGPVSSMKKKTAPGLFLKNVSIFDWNKAEAEEASQTKKEEEDDEHEYEENATIFVKNLNFDTEEASLLELFSKIGKCKANVARKLSPKGESLSMGYGFVKFKKVSVQTPWTYLAFCSSGPIAWSNLSGPISCKNRRQFCKYYIINCFTLSKFLITFNWNMALKHIRYFFSIALNE